MIKVIFFNQLNLISQQVAFNFNGVSPAFKKERCRTDITSPGLEPLQTIGTKKNRRNSLGDRRLTRLVGTYDQVQSTTEFNSLTTESAEALQFNATQYHEASPSIV